MLNSVNMRADDEIDTHMKSEYQDQEAGMVENSWPLHLPLLDAAAVFFAFPANIRSFWAGSAHRLQPNVGPCVSCRPNPRPPFSRLPRCIVPFCHPLLCIRSYYIPPDPDCIL